MLRRYNCSADAGTSSPAPPPLTGARFSSVAILDEGPDHITNKAFIIGATPGATITIKTISSVFSGSSFNYPDFTVVGKGSMYVVDNVMTLTADIDGNANFTALLYNGPIAPNILTVGLQITAVSAGSIGVPSSTVMSHRL